MTMDLTESTARMLGRVEEILEGGRYCYYCRALTNHRTSDHEEQEPEEPPC